MRGGMPLGMHSQTHHWYVWFVWIIGCTTSVFYGFCVCQTPFPRSILHYIPIICLAIPVLPCIACVCVASYLAPLYHPQPFPTHPHHPQNTHKAPTKHPQVVDGCASMMAPLACVILADGLSATMGGVLRGTVCSMMSLMC